MKLCQPQKIIMKSEESEPRVISLNIEPTRIETQ